MKRGIARSPFVLVGVAASLVLAVACSDDEDDGGGGTTGGNAGEAGDGGTSGSSGTGGTTGGSSGSGGTTGGTSGNAGSGGSTGGTAGTTAGTGGSGNTGNEGGMGGEDVGGMGGAGGEGGEVVVYDVLGNPGFETGNSGKLDPIPSWEDSGELEASYIEWSGGVGATHRLAHWREWQDPPNDKYVVRTFQTVAPIANGTYTFSIWVQRSAVTEAWGVTEQYLYATGYDVANPTAQVTANTAPSASAYVQVTLSNIVVTSGSVTVGVYTSASKGNDGWANFDDATLTKNP